MIPNLTYYCKFIFSSRLFVGGAKGGAPPKVRGCEGGAAPVSEGAPPSCTPKYFTNQGALPNVASPKQHPPQTTPANVALTKVAMGAQWKRC